MHRIMMMFTGAVVFFFMAVPACLAQEGLPRGDYKETCRNMRMDGDRLLAECQARDGDWHGTSVDTRNCQDRIINDNGNLRCAVGEGGYGRDYDRDRGYDRDRDRDNGYGNGRYYGREGLPPGDYKETCQNMHIEGNTLYANCQKRNGDWHDTRLRNVDQCQSPIANVNGNLRCPK